MQTVISAMYDSIANAMQPDTRLFKLNAIWVEGGLRVFNKYSDPKVKLTHRIAAGDVVSLDGADKLIDVTLDEEWEIIECNGTLDNSVLQVTLKSIDTDEIKTVTI